MVFAVDEKISRLSTDEEATLGIIVSSLISIRQTSCNTITTPQSPVRLAGNLEVSGTACTQPNALVYRRSGDFRENAPEAYFCC